MRIGSMFDIDQPIDNVVAQVASLASAGLETAWTSQIFGYDALTVLAVVGREVPGIGLGTAVVPTYPRNPVMLAAQALTVQAATGGRLTLGIGLSHQVVIENVFGQSFDKPARHMREYLSILVPILEGEQVSFTGETLKASTFGPLGITAPPAPVLVAALGDTMLGIAGRHGVGHHHLDDRARHHRSPHGADHPGRGGQGGPSRAPGGGRAAGLRHRRRRRPPGPRRRSSSPSTGPLPSYRAMLDREGAAGPADVAIVGTASEVVSQILRFADVGPPTSPGRRSAPAKEIKASIDVLAALVGTPEPAGGRATGRCGCA